MDHKIIKADRGLARSLNLLSLNEDFDREELRRAYHKKLFEIHPDTSPVENPGVHVSELIEARQRLEEDLVERAAFIGKREERRDEEGASLYGSQHAEPIRREGDSPRREGEPGGADGYEWYKEGSRIFADALEFYWKERLKWSQIPEDSPVLSKFRKMLLQARELYARVLVRFPGGIWTPDAVEKIARINKWFGG